MAQCSKIASELDLYNGAGDGNRTRTISLGICAIRAAIQPDLREGLPLSDRERPFVTEVNGTLMARRSCPAPGQMALRPSAFRRRGLAVRLIRSEHSGMLPHVPGGVGWRHCCQSCFHLWEEPKSELMA